MTSSGCSVSVTNSTSGPLKAPRHELWNLYNDRHHQGEYIRVFPLFNWT